MKKEYREPTITSEEIKVGVFGSYGSQGGDGHNGGGHHGGGGHHHRPFFFFFC